MHGFPDQITIALRQLLQVETKEMNQLITADRMLTINRREESQGIVRLTVDRELGKAADSVDKVFSAMGCTC